MSNRWYASCFAVLCGFGFVASPAFAQRAVQAAHLPSIVKNGRAVKLRATSSSETLNLVISLPLRNEAAMAGTMADLYNPQSPNFHHWLTSAQFDEQFGPTQQDYAALVAWARAAGLTITAKSANHHVLSVSGSTATVNRAFHVELTDYHDNSRNRDFHAPDREPSLDLDIPVFAVSGLDTSNPRVSMLKKDPNAGSAEASSTPVKAGPSSSARPAAQPRLGSDPSGYFLPSDMRAAYYGSGPLTGAGQNVAIFSYDGYIASDLNVFYSKTGMAATVPVTNVLTGGFSGACQLNTPCNDGEQILDIVQVMGMAPGLANIFFYEGLSAVTELNQIVSDNTASVITSSWGGGDFGPATDPIFQQMAMQGQTFLNATGDSGAFNGFTYLPPSSSPYITQVGGTDLVTSSAGGPWASETAWAYSGGGFFDPGITIPTWQQQTGVITSTNTGSATLRNSPDVAAEANFDNVTVVNGTYSTGYGGTSYAAPRMAGYLALANQQSVANGYSRLGFINPLLYELGLRSTASTYYHDITSGSAPASSGPAVSFSAVPGYDLVTGWGSPNYTGLLNALTGPDFSFVVNPSTVTVVRGASVNVDLPIAATNGFSAIPTFTVSGLPTGVTAAITAGDRTKQTFTFTADSTTKLSTSTVTISGSALSITHSATLQLTTVKRTTGDFTLSASNASAAQLQTGSSTVTVRPGAGLVGPVSLSVSGLPAGVTASFDNASTSGTAVLTFSPAISAAPGNYTVSVVGSAGGTTFSHIATLVLSVTAAQSAITNGGFESGIAPWTGSTTGASTLSVLCDRSCGYYPHSGTNYAYLDGYGATHTDIMRQSFSIPAGTSATANFWLWISSLETTTSTKNDTLTVQVLNSSGTVLATLASFSNLNKGSGYVLYSYDMTPYLGQTVQLQFTGVENRTRSTGFLLDDISVVSK